MTTDAFRRIRKDAPSIDDRLDRLSRLTPDDRKAGRPHVDGSTRRSVDEIETTARYRQHRESAQELGMDARALVGGQIDGALQKPNAFVGVAVQEPQAR